MSASPGSPDTISEIVELLRARSRWTAHELAAELRAGGSRAIRRSTVNQILYHNPGTFTHDSSIPPRWQLLRADEPVDGHASLLTEGAGEESSMPRAEEVESVQRSGTPKRNPYDPYLAHGSDCRCRETTTLDDINMPYSVRRQLAVFFGRSPKSVQVSQLLAVTPRLPEVLADYLNRALEADGRGACPYTSGAVETPWQDASASGRARHEWPDDWDGVEWAHWSRNSLDRWDPAQIDAFLREIEEVPLVEMLAVRARSPRELGEYRLASRPHEWVERQEEILVHATDWDQEEILRVLHLSRSDLALAARTSLIRELMANGRRTQSEVLAFGSYLDLADRGEVVPEPRIRRLLDAFPPDRPFLLTQRLDMINNTISINLDDHEEPEDDELLDVVEPVLPVPAPVSYVAEDGGPDPLRTVRKLLPGGEGTRGEPPIIYTQTLLDRVLLPTLLDREPTLVVLSGNAGDGKTAFIAQVLAAAGRTYQPGVNTYDVSLGARGYLVILDGSEDAETLTNDELLERALGAFRGPTATSPEQGTVIAINKGRLLSFLSDRRNDYAFLWRVVSGSLIAGMSASESPYLLIDLNDRTTIGPSEAESVFGGVVSKLTSWSGWRDECSRCDAEDRCPVLYNIRSLENDRVRSQLWKTFAAVDLDDRIHTTARHLVTKLASAVVAGGTCSAVRETVRADEDFPASAYLYNALYTGGEVTSSVDSSVMDRVAASYDPSDLSSPSRDRRLAFHLVHGSVDPLIGERGSSHGAYLKAAGADLERSSIDEKSGPGEPEYRERMLNFTHNVSRRLFHLDPGNDLAPLAPLRTMDTFLDMLTRPESISEDVRTSIIQNLNATLGVERSAIHDLLAPRDYARGLSGRGFALLIPRTYFSIGLATKQGARYRTSPFLESWPRALLLTVEDPDRGHVASLSIPLLLYEVLERAGRGFRPATQSERSFIIRLNGFYRRLTEHQWSVRPSYALYDNGTVLSRAVLDVDKLTMAEI
jgi:hypothetical protein